MYHETSVIFNTREPWAERPSPPNIRTATKVIIVIKNDIEKKKNLYLTPAETIANVSHVHSFFTDSRLNITEKKKILLVLRNVPLIVNLPAHNDGGDLWSIICDHKERTASSENTSSSWVEEGVLHF